MHALTTGRQNLRSTSPHDGNKADRGRGRGRGQDHAQRSGESTSMRHPLPAFWPGMPAAANPVVAYPPSVPIHFPSTGLQLCPYTTYHPLTQVRDSNPGMQDFMSKFPFHGRQVNEGQGRYHSTGQGFCRLLGSGSPLVDNNLTGFWGQVPGLRDARSKIRSRHAVDSNLRGCARSYGSQGQQRQRNPELLDLRVLQWMENVPSEESNRARDIDATSDATLASPQKRNGETGPSDSMSNAVRTYPAGTIALGR